MGVRLASALNLLKLWLFLALACALPALIGAVLGGWRGGAVFAFGALLAATAVYIYCDRVVLGMLRARELVQSEQPALRSLSERLAARMRVAKPRLYLLPDDFPRALVAGRGPSSSSLAVSQGFLSSASAAEIEGVVAHELAHVANRDVAVQSVAVIAATTLVELARLGGYAQRVFLFFLAPIASAIEHALLSPRREIAADKIAAAACGSPHGLADALARMEQASELVSFAASPTSEPLYALNPFALDGIARMFDTHPPFADRIRRLRKLDPQWREKLRAA